MTNAYRFSAIFSASLLLTVALFLVPCHPSSFCKDKGIERRLLNFDHSLVVLVGYLSFFSWCW